VDCPKRIRNARDVKVSFLGRNRGLFKKRFVGVIEKLASPKKKQLDGIYNKPRPGFYTERNPVKVFFWGEGLKTKILENKYTYNCSGVDRAIARGVNKVRVEESSHRKIKRKARK